jgi:methylated-DNA-[protein]-cysteine S-methyltransferase
MTRDLGAALRRSGKTDVGAAAAAAARRLTEAAGAAGLVDVATATADSPLGTLVVAATGRGLVRIAFPGEDVLDDLARRVSPRVLEAPARLDPVRRQLDEYFAGRRRHFELPLDWRLTTRFGRRVLEAAVRIEPGDVATYGEVAVRIGHPRAARAVGNALAGNPIPVVVPCHRVVPAGGGVGGYGGGPERKARLLALEGARA